MFGIASFIVLVICLVILFKYQNFQGNIANFVIITIMLAIIGSLSYVYLGSHSDVSDFDGLVAFSKVYFSWLGNLFGNTGDIAGYAVKQNWTAIENLTAVK